MDLFECKTTASQASISFFTYINRIDPRSVVRTARLNCKIQAIPLPIFVPMMHSTLMPSKRLCGLLWILSFIALQPDMIQAQPTFTNHPELPTGEAGVDYNVLNKHGQKEGAWIRVWPNGTRYYQGSFKEAIPFGLFVYYYESGEVMSEIINTENGRKSFAKLFRKNGTLQAEGLYLKMQIQNTSGEAEREKHGEWKYFDGNGQLRLIENYKLGELDGKTQTITAKGKVIEKGDYILGNRNGTWSTWDEIGVNLSEINYENGLFHGVCRVNYPNGAPRSIGMYRGGVEDGYWKTFMEDGTPENTRQYEEGQLIQEIHENGTVLESFPDGKPRKEYTVVNQKKEGPFREWHDSGEWTFVEDQDEMTGDIFVRRVLKGEQIRMEGEYIHGLIDGEVFHFDKNGRIQKVERYEAGKLIETEDR